MRQIQLDILHLSGNAYLSQIAFFKTIFVSQERFDEVHLNFA